MEMVSKNVDCSRKYEYDVCRKCGLEFPRLIAKMLYYFWSLNEAVTHLYLQAWWLSCFRLSKDLRRMAMLPRHLLKPMASESAFRRRKSFLKRNQTSYNKLVSDTAEGTTTLLIRKTSENHAVSFKTVTLGKFNSDNLYTYWLALGLIQPRRDFNFIFKNSSLNVTLTS